MNAPVRLLAALERVRQAHPYAASGYLYPSEAMRVGGEEILATLVALDENGRIQGIDALSPVQVRQLVLAIGSRLNRVGAIDVLGLVAERHPDVIDRKVAAEAFLLSNGSKRLAIHFHQWISSAKHTDLWRRVAASERPRDTIVDLYLRKQEQFILGLQRVLEEERLGQIVPVLLHQFLRMPILESVSSFESPATLKAWSDKVLRTPQRDEWLAYFISRTHTRPWLKPHAILEEVHSRFEVPGKHSFWDAVNQEGQDAYMRWLLDHELTKLLGEGDRVQFWRRFMRDGMEMPIAAANGEAVLIVFKHFVAPQFVEMGRATYLLPRNLVTLLRRRGTATDVYSAIRGKHHEGKSFGRYEHRGYHWEPAAEAEVRRVLNLLGR